MSYNVEYAVKVLVGIILYLDPPPRFAVEYPDARAEELLKLVLYVGYILVPLNGLFLLLRR